MSPTTWVAVAVLACVFLIVVASMVRSLRGKEATSSASVPAPPLPPQDTELGAARTDVLPGTYVSTTTAADWLDRVPGHTLGRRSPADVRVHATGVVVRRAGARDLFVPLGDVVEVRRSGGMAGKYTGGEGLVVLRWSLHDDSDHAGGDAGGMTLDTGLRLRRRADREVLVDAVRDLVAERDRRTQDPQTPAAPGPATSGPDGDAAHPPTSEEPR